MESILLTNGKTITPSYHAFLSNYGRDEDYDGIFDASREYISKRFYDQSIDMRLDIFEIYLEYFFRAIYESYIKGDDRLGEPVVSDNEWNTLEISSSIEKSSYRFIIHVERTYFGDIRSIAIAIVDGRDDYLGYRAAIGFTAQELTFRSSIGLGIKDRIQKVCKSIMELNPDMATWYYLQGINLIEDATCNLGRKE